VSPGATHAINRAAPKSRTARIAVRMVLVSESRVAS
jgi:hypothetical protein